MVITMKRIPLSVVLLSAMASPALAASPFQAYSLRGKVIDSNLGEASHTLSQTFEQPSQSGIPGLMTVWLCLTDADSSTSAVTMSCTASHDRGTTSHTLQTCATAAGVCTSSDASWVKAPGGTACWTWRVDVEGYPHVGCTITDTGGDASDLIKVWLSFATKG